MNPIVMTATRKAAEIRSKNSFDNYQPINIYDLCHNLGLTVRFVDVNMEGMYFSQRDGSSPQILISNQRPFGRRAFTCGHEFGHHVFEHGDRIDLLAEGESKGYDKDEFLVDTFSGALLMPIAGVLAEFAKRSWNIKTGTPDQFYIVSSVFGTGYQSLIIHCQKNSLISDSQAKILQRQTPGKMLENILGRGITNSHFKIFDSSSISPVIDLEVSNFIFFPDGTKMDSEILTLFKKTSAGLCYVAQEPGIVRASNDSNSYFVRIQNSNYVGLAEYRHLENLKEVTI